MDSKVQKNFNDIDLMKPKTFIDGEPTLNAYYQAKKEIKNKDV